jgi:hypothetical protein
MNQIKKIGAAVALAAGLVAAAATPAVAATPAGVTAAAPSGLTAAAPAAVERRCSQWSQVIPSVWAIVCLDRDGALFKPYGEMRNNSASPVTMDQFIYLNGLTTLSCGTWPSTAAPGAQLICTNNTWYTAGSPRTASGDFWVNGIHTSLTTPSFS